MSSGPMPPEFLGLSLMGIYLLACESRQSSPPYVGRFAGSCVCFCVCLAPLSPSILKELYSLEAGVLFCYR